MDISVQLSTALGDFDCPRLSPTEYIRDPWLATSALQKAIWRGDTETALKAVAVLAPSQSERLWRRLVVIALEDVGIADPSLARTTLWVSGRAAWRRDHGGEQKVASYLVTQLCRAVKCRDACDVLVIADLHPFLKQQRAEFGELSATELAGIVADENRPLPERVLAAWYVGGTHQFPGAQLKGRRGSFQQLLHVYEHLGMPPEVLEVAELGSTRTREAHPISLPLIWQQATRTPTRAIRNEAPQSLGIISGWPSEAYDMRCRPGQRALSLFRNRVSSALTPRLTGVAPGQVSELLGTAVFRLEGAVVDQRLVYPGSDAILDGATTAHVCWSGLPLEQAGPLLSDVREQMTELHHCRQIVAGVAQ